MATGWCATEQLQNLAIHRLWHHHHHLGPPAWYTDQLWVHMSVVLEQRQLVPCFTDTCSHPSTILPHIGRPGCQCQLVPVPPSTRVLSVLPVSRNSDDRCSTSWLLGWLTRYVKTVDDKSGICECQIFALTFIWVCLHEVWRGSVVVRV